MKNVSLRQLRTFSEVARHLSFVRAAESMHLSAPAVTMQIKELEERVGSPLFDRESKQIALTTVGEYLLLYTRRVLGTLKEAEDLVARLRGINTGRVTLGIVSTAQYFIPTLLARFQREHVGVQVVLRVGNREQLVGMLAAGEVDIAVMGRAPKEIATRAEPFATHPHVFVAAPDHSINQMGHPPVSTLQSYGLLVREAGSGTRAALEQFLADAQVAPEFNATLPSNELIKQAVIAGLGISFLSLHTLGLELSNGLLSIVHVEKSPVMRTWNLVRPSHKTLSPACEALRYFIIEHAAALLDERFGAWQTDDAVLKRASPL